jgi:outer membrane protein assembly factor BamB
LKLAYSPNESTRIRVELDGFYPEEAVLDGDAHEKVVSLLARVPDWTLKVSGSIGYDPVVDGDGRVFIVDRSGTVTALEGRSGDVIWSLDTKDLSGLLPKPLVHGDRLVVASVDGTLRSLDRRTGKVRWQENGLPTELAPAIAGSTIAIVSTKNELVGVHSGTGEITFTVALPGAVQVPPIAIQGRYILTVTTDGVVRKFDSRNGQSVWTQDGIAGRGVLSTPTITKHGVVIPAEDGSLTLLDTQTGGQLWKQTRLGAVSLSVAHRGNVLYLAQENRVLSRSVKDGRALTSMTAERPWTSPPTLLGDSLLVGNRAGQIFVLDAESLAPRYQILSKGRVVVTPVLLSDGVMVVAYENGTILGFLE